MKKVTHLVYSQWMRALRCLPIARKAGGSNTWICLPGVLQTVDSCIGFYSLSIIKKGEVHGAQTGEMLATRAMPLISLLLSILNTGHGDLTHLMGCAQVTTEVRDLSLYLQILLYLILV